MAAPTGHLDHSAKDDAAYCAKEENRYATPCGGAQGQARPADPCNHALERQCDPGTTPLDVVPDANADDPCFTAEPGPAAIDCITENAQSQP